MTIATKRATSEEIVRQYYQLLNDKQPERAEPLLAEDVVRIGVDSDDKPPHITQGKAKLLERIRRMTADNAAVIVSNVQAAGDNVTCFVQIATDTSRREGIAPLEETAEFLVQDGLIKSYRVVSTPESMAKIKSVMP